MEGSKKNKKNYVVFWLTRRPRVRGGRGVGVGVGVGTFWGILQDEQQVFACCQTHSEFGPQKMSIKLAV